MVNLPEIKNHLLGIYCQTNSHHSVSISYYSAGYFIIIWIIDAAVDWKETQRANVLQFDARIEIL